LEVLVGELVTRRFEDSAARAAADGADRCDNAGVHVTGVAVAVGAGAPLDRKSVASGSSESRDRHVAKKNAHYNELVEHESDVHVLPRELHARGEWLPLSAKIVADAR
jgi:hypothetical protein